MTARDMVRDTAGDAVRVRVVTGMRRSGVERALEGSVSWAEGVESPAAVELVPVVARRADSFLVIWAMPEDVEGAPRGTRGSIGIGGAEWA